MKTTNIILNDLVRYYEYNLDLVMLPFIYDDIKDFFDDFLLGCKVEFHCKKCVADPMNGWGVYTKWKNKTHKGIIREYSTGMNYNTVPSSLDLTLTLNRIRHEHIVDTNKPITIYGKLPDDILKIIDDVNIISNTKKFNI